MGSECSVAVRRTIGAAMISLAGLALGAGAARADNIDITIDFAKIMKLDRPAETIVIGNPGIADATVQDEQTIVLTGKTAGATNLIVLDEDGNEIANTLIRVSSDVRQLTTVFYGSERQTFSCAPTCEQVISVGDSTVSFEAAKTQIEQRQVFSAGQ